MSRILGIDPGKKGGVALIDTINCTLAVTDMPVEATTKSRALTSALVLSNMIEAGEVDYAYLEEVGAMPEEGAVGAFSFGRGFGRLEGVCAGAKVALTLVRPQEWKSRTNTPKEKDRAVTRATQLFPSAAHLFVGPRGGIKDGRAEAAIIAFYGAIKLGQTPQKPLMAVEFPCSL